MAGRHLAPPPAKRGRIDTSSMKPVDEAGNDDRDEPRQTPAASGWVQPLLNTDDIAFPDWVAVQGASDTQGVNGRMLSLASGRNALDIAGILSGEVAPVPIIDGVLEITRQPAAHGRFRYGKEGRKTPISGNVEGSFPSIAVTDRFRHLIPDGTIVYVSLVTRHDNDFGPIPHWHTLEVKEGSVAKPLIAGSAIFSNLVVTRAPMPTGSSEKRNPEDQHIIRLMFTMNFRAANGALLTTRVVSDNIFGIELKIHRVSHSQIPVTGQGDVILLTSKVKKKNILIRLRDREVSSFDPGVDSGWVLDDQNRLTCTIDAIHVHYQYAVVAQFPPYWDRTINSSRTLDVSLIDIGQGLESNSTTIEYIPASNPDLKIEDLPFSRPCSSTTIVSPEFGQLDTAGSATIPAQDVALVPTSLETK